MMILNCSNHSLLSFLFLFSALYGLTAGYQMIPVCLTRAGKTADWDDLEADTQWTSTQKLKPSASNFKLPCAVVDVGKELPPPPPLPASLFLDENQGTYRAETAIYFV